MIILVDRNSVTNTVEFVRIIKDIVTLNRTKLNQSIKEDIKCNNNLYIKLPKDKSDNLGL